MKGLGLQILLARCPRACGLCRAEEQDALNGYDPSPTKYVGLLIGAGAGVASQGGILLPIGVPVVYTLSQLAPTIKIREETISNINHKYKIHIADQI